MLKRLALILSLCLLLSGCGKGGIEAYRQISQEDAKAMMDTQEAMVLDVREADEYASGHIPGALLFPVGSISQDSAEQLIPSKDTVLLVYCRSGNRSKDASSALAELGYTKVYEFGGINTWPYEVVTD